MTDRRYGLADPAQFAELTGLQFLQAIINGEIPHPPICQTLGFHLTEAGDGFAAFEGETSRALLNPLGGVHGGWSLTILDSVTACAVHSKLPAGVGYGSVETKVNFVRPIRADLGRVRAEATLLSMGRTIATAEGRLIGPDGKLLAHGLSTIMIMG